MKLQTRWTGLLAGMLAGWIGMLAGLGAEEGDGFESIFDGKSLTGWRIAPEGGEKTWTVADGVIHGEGKENRQVYLIWTGDEQLADFELRFQYRLPTKGNTGVEVRARIDPTRKRAFEGYHADIGHVGIGDDVLGAWDFHFGSGTRPELPCRRGTRLVIDEEGQGHPEVIEGAVQVEEIRDMDWNEGRIVAKGRHLQFYLNGKLASEFTDNIRKGLLERGFIGLQLHDKGMVVEFKDLKLKRL